MNGMLAHTLLSAGLVLSAGTGFYSFRCEAAPEHQVPRVVRDLEHAVTTADIEELSIVLNSRPDLVNLGMYGGPPLHVAAKYNQPLVIDYLLKHGADRDARGGDRGLNRCTALHWACLWGSKDAAEMLLAEGFAIEDRNDVFNSTPLHWAAFGSSRVTPDPGHLGDYEGLVRMLIDHGAAVDTVNDRGISAISVASDGVAKVLAEHKTKQSAHPTTQPGQDGVS
jgi:ankyrin repeat protein